MIRGPEKAKGRRSEAVLELGEARLRGTQPMKEKSVEGRKDRRTEEKSM